MSNARPRQRRRSGEPEVETEAEAESESEKEDYSQSVFVTLQQNSDGKKPLKSSLKKCRSLPSYIFSSELESWSSDLDFCPPELSTMVLDKRGYFYESVGGVFYTLEWPLKSSASSTELDMPPNIQTQEVNKPDPSSKCGKLLSWLGCDYVITRLA